MMEHSILFNTREVQATLEGRKTQVRVVIKHQPDEVWRRPENEFIHPRTHQPVEGLRYGNEVVPAVCPLGSVGDILWVREKFGALEFGYDDYGYCDEYKDVSPKIVAKAPKSLLKNHDRYGFIYAADDTDWEDVKWHPSIHMSREACRLFLKITNVSVKRLKKMTEDDAIAEGYGSLCECNAESMACENCMNTGYSYPPMLDFVECWHTRHESKGYGWKANPFVWVIEFEKYSLK